MSLDAKGIGLFVWKIIRFSACCSYKFVRKYPVMSGILIFVLYVYIRFPDFFFILLYASPILVCTVIFIRFYWKTEHRKVQVVSKKDSDEISSGDVNRTREEKSPPAVNKSNGPSLRHQKSVRRNARKAVLPFDRIDSPDLFFSRSIYDILSGESNLLEEHSGLVSDVSGSSNVEHGESSSKNETRNDQALHEMNSLFDKEALKPRSASGDSFEGQSEKSPDYGVKSLRERDNSKDGEVKEDQNKAVEWTKDDEKNLMDLGLTEIERNKRLESLIVKRRARKMFKMAIEKSMMDKGIVPNSQIAPILVVKNNILGGSSNPNEEGLPMPGSAPSILLPTQNPFDLPYDPFEEKPNLTADSFQQEFKAANQKEMFFCRHESFRHGPLFTFETSQDCNNDPFNPYYSAEKRLVEGLEVDKIERVSDDEGGHHQHNDSLGFGSEIDLIEVEESKAINSSEEKTEKIRGTANDKTEIGETHDLSGSEVMEIDSIKNNDSCCSPSSSDDSASGLDQTSKPLSLCSSQVRKAFNLMIPPKGKTVSKHPNDSSPSPRRTEFNLFYNSYKRHGHHTRNCSIASDLQVEVSEVGSPTLLTDGTISPVEDDSVTYDGDVERDVNSDGDELWGGSFNLSRDTNREKLRELDDIIEEDSVVVKFSGLNKKPEEPIALISPPEQEAKQILDTTSALPSRLDTTEDGASYPTNINCQTRDVIRIGDEDKGYKHGNIETSYESKRTTDSEEKMEERQPSKYIEEDTCNLLKQGIGDAPNAVQSIDDLESVPDRIANQNSTYNIPPITQQPAENSIDHLSSNFSPGTSEGLSNTTKKSTNDSIVHNMNELALEGTNGKEDSSIEFSKDESKTSTSSKDAKELSKPSGESNPDSIEPLGGLERLIEDNTGTDPSKSKEGNAKSNDPKTMVKEQSAAEADRTCNVNDSSTDKVTKNGSSTHVLDGEVEPQILSQQKVVMESSKTIGATSAGSVTDAEHESKRLTEAEANSELPTSKGVSNSVSNTRNDGDVQTLSGQECLSDALQLREDNLKAINESISGVDNSVTGITVDRNAMEASKLKESEVNAVNTKEKDSNEEAK